MAFDPSNHRWLFHGTGEAISGLLRPGGYDGVLWTAEYSSVAQNYIPITGGSTFASISEFQLNERVRPSASDPFYSVAKMIGPGASNVEYDDLGRAKSWSIPEGYARYRDVINHIENVLGYPNRSQVSHNFTYELRTDGWDPETREHKIVPANFKCEGSLLIIDGFQGMKFLDISRGESDLTDLQYHKLKTFREAEKNGFDGIVIDDFTQSKKHGNVGHRSIGFFESAIQHLTITSIPAVNFDWDDDIRVKDTPEFSAWRNALSAKELMHQEITHSAQMSPKQG